MGIINLLQRPGWVSGVLCTAQNLKTMGMDTGCPETSTPLAHRQRAFGERGSMPFLVDSPTYFLPAHLPIIPPGHLSGWKKFLNFQRQKQLPPNVLTPACTSLHTPGAFYPHTCTHNSPCRYFLTLTPSPGLTPVPGPLTHPSRPTFAHFHHSHT